MKYAGKIGFVKIEEDKDRPGVFIPVVTERFMRGDFEHAITRLVDAEKTNRDLQLNNRVSVIGDAYLWNNLGYLTYVTYQGVKWEVTAIEAKRPRLLINFGGVYNGQTE